MWHASASWHPHGRAAPKPLDRLNLTERKLLTGAVKGLLGGVGADPTKWGAPSDPEPGHQDRPPVGVNVLHMKRRLTDQEITVLPGGLSVPAVDPE